MRDDLSVFVPRFRSPLQRNGTMTQQPGNATTWPGNATNTAAWQPGGAQHHSTTTVCGDTAQPGSLATKRQWSIKHGSNLTTTATRRNITDVCGNWRWHGLTGGGGGATIAATWQRRHSQRHNQ
jgi:hypothetical protein